VLDRLQSTPVPQTYLIQYLMAASMLFPSWRILLVSTANVKSVMGSRHKYNVRCNPGPGRRHKGRFARGKAFVIHGCVRSYLIRQEERALIGEGRIE
jgi:hypothetical protein